MRRTGFEDDHVPLKTLPRTVKSGPMLETVWSLKAAPGPVKLLGTLTADAWTHFETNPAIERISSFPVQIEYTKPDGDGFLKGVPHIPDLGVRFRPRNGENRGRVVYVDVVSHQLERKTGWARRNLESLKAAFREQLMAGYNVLSETSLWIEPRLTNMRTVLRHLKADVRAEKDVVLEIVSRLDGSTIGEVKRLAGFPRRTYEVLGPQGEVAWSMRLDQECRCFTALMQLFSSGDVAFDMSAPISETTAIRFAGSRSAYR